MKLLKNAWTYVVAGFVFLLGLFVMERNQRKNAEARLGSAEADKRDAVLENDEKHIDAEIAELKRKIEEDEKSEPVGDLSDKEIEEYWKKNQ